ncbi:hypothetical protein L1987_16478 [Smallanthus sonchifolius]|uniref:Uncharacterized protein n=1 Tax=Smallanthus sonchifolius TaxID=185202 RepID=A0ACB9J8C4_9ASTR|nr:hypothetical protein L1987_16478 [Smallanthus sonchifolius]
MEPLGDDELLYIFNKIPRYNLEDKRSFAQVSKRFMKVAYFGKHRLHSCFPDLLFDILPSSPNVRTFHCSKPLSNNHLKLLAQSCPKLKLLDLRPAQDLDPPEPGEFEFEFEFDFDDDGLCAVANACSHLREVYLNRRLHIGDAGIVSLATSCKNLTFLNLKGCIRVTDESLKPIGESGIRNLNLEGCYLITDLGLKYLANGDLKNSLQHLILTECDRISDHGVIHLKQMVHLTELNLSKCGVHVTDPVMVALLSHLPNIEILDLSWLINVTDISLLVIGSKCLNLKEIYLSGCEAITAEGLWAFTGHEALKRLVLFSCYNFSWEDVESVALTCIRLEYLGLMKRIKTPMPETSIDYLRTGNDCCGIDWDEDSHTIFW